MALIEVPEMPVLHGEEAVELLNQLIEEFHQQKGKKLTEKQAEVLVKAASQMICIIRAETWAKSTGKPHTSNHLDCSRGFGVFYVRIRRRRVRIFVFSFFSL